MNLQQQQQQQLPQLPPIPPRPDGVLRHFWALLTLLAQEPPLGWLPEALRQAAAVSAALVPQPPEEEEEEEESPRGAAAAFEGAEEPGQRRRRGESRHRAPNGEPLLGRRSQHTFRQQLLGPWPLEALKAEMCAGHPMIWKTCHKSLLLFNSFRQRAGCPSAWPLPSNHIQGFMNSMGLLGFSPLVIHRHVAALSYMSCMLGFPDPLQDTSILHMMEDLERQMGVPVTLTEETLEGLVASLEVVCPDSYERLLFQAAFLLAFFLALKPEEIVMEDWASPNPQLLYRSDCEILEDSIGLRLSVSETGLERTMYRLQCSREHQLCPVNALHNYLAVRPSGEGPLFMYSNEDPLSSEHFLAIFYSALIQIGLPPEQYNMHSFWLGSVVTAVTYRYPATIIRHLARWPSRGIRRRQDIRR